MTPRAGGLGGLALGALLGGLACNAILGVEDVEEQPPGGRDGGSSSGEPTTPQPPDGRPDTPDGGDPPTVQHGELALGYLHGCARRTNGSVICWGDNGAGQLGGGEAGGDPEPTPRQVPSIDDATTVAAGNSHTCAIRATGKVSCWGYNFFGQLGDGTNERRAAPADAVGVADATRLSAGQSFTCAVREAKTVACWGIGNNGQLGDEEKADRNVPTAVAALANVEGIASGQEHSCAIVTGGEVMCWGRNDVMQVGIAEPAVIPTPIRVPGLSGVVRVAAGNQHTCVLGGDRRVLCWGTNAKGQLGIGTASATSTATPSAVPGVTDAVALAAGAEHTCAARADGTAVCWGAGAEGQIGAPPAKPTFTSATTVTDLSGAIGVWAGAIASCAMTNDGKVACWGSNTLGQLGNGTTDSTPTPRPLLGFP